MNGSYVLDTNIVIAVFDQEAVVLERIVAAERILVPIPAIGELFHGTLRSRRSADNVQKIERLAQAHKITPIDLETARHYGAIKGDLRRKGKPIPENDIWIAAIARQHNATVATRDQHFDAIESVAVEHW